MLRYIDDGNTNTFSNFIVSVYAITHITIYQFAITKAL